MKKILGIFLIASMAPSIALGQKYQRPIVEKPVDYRGREPGAPTPPSADTLADVKWFVVFNDPKLQELIREALANNYDLRVAVTRIDTARASLGITRSDQFPQVGSGADFTTEGRSRNGVTRIPEPIQRDRSFGSVFLNLLSFEIDIWGRLRKATAAARSDLLSTEEARKAVLTTLVSDVATAYFNLRELDFELEIAKRTLVSRQASLRIISLRQRNGVSNLLELRQAEQLVYSAAEVIPAVEQASEQQENFISVLIGKNPRSIERGLSLTEQQLPPSIPAGLPSDLIARRPDILAAEQQLIAANARIGVAKAAYFPRISLTSFLGSESNALSTLFNPSRAIWNVLPEVSQPIFTAGRLKSNVRFSQAERDFFLVNYERTIQTAFREVSDSLIAHQKVREVRTQRELLVTTLQDRSRLAYMRYNGGVATLLDALDADRDLFNAELSLAQTRRDELLTVVQLYKALGGGWQQ
jgi:NodT family efflux transporter outer membrane factor (OMF) lipoprotein